MNGGDDFAEIFESLLGHVMVAKCDIEVHVPCRFDIAFRARTDRTELNFTAVKAKRPGHRL